MGEQGTRESFFHPPRPFSLFVIIRVFLFLLCFREELLASYLVILVGDLRRIHWIHGYLLGEYSRTKSYLGA